MTSGTTWIPTSSVSFEDQVRILRSYVMLSDRGMTEVHYKAVVDDTSLARTQISGVNAFFQSLGFLSLSKRGFYIPSAPVVRFASVMPPEEPFKELIQTLSESRLYDAIANKYMVAHSERLSWDEIVELLLKLAKRSERFRAESALEWLIRTGLLRRIEDNQVELIPPNELHSSEDRKKSTTQAFQFDLPADKNLLLFRIKGRRYAVDRDVLLEFIKKHGTEVDEEMKIA